LPGGSLPIGVRALDWFDASTQKAKEGQQLRRHAPVDQRFGKVTVNVVPASADELT
jgi:hypothetical protein